MTYGGFMSNMVVGERFVRRVPSNLSLSRAAPLLCAGATAYSSRRLNAERGAPAVRLVGAGFLGKIAVKIARAMYGGFSTAVTSAENFDEASRRGVEDVFCLGNKAQTATRGEAFSFVSTPRPCPTT
ncbi:hypothetical protein [Lentzea sp. NEAU-D7]|uniref:hypothetical protein n=1 Tax=Lentzea sp. NEAU-D7 TaxID=2994667 RepID=UPI00224B49D3|nr:hypothetical protein [Lentzea sp. NEAU-D7]MCX2954550.1 hypothetical protein [Lentzea sp. NEAU-D7]